MNITHPRMLQSIRNEAGRQALFYDRRGDTPLSQQWSELESIAHAGLTTRASLTITLTVMGSTTIPIPIKPGEQA